MIQYSGWININQSVDGENEEDIKEILMKIEQSFDESSIVNEYHKIITSNYSNFLHISGAHNHNGNTKTKIINLIRSLGELAKGSYGVIYFWDDEDSEYANEYQVFKLVRGVLSIEQDSYLSPCNPVIEE